ncbi:MAG: hypothetical protein WB609_00935 [Candidatus Cybelea sp.]
MPEVAYLSRVCSNGAALRVADTAASEAQAVNDSDRFELAQEAAREYWRCAHNIDNELAYDIARLQYAIWYAYSFSTHAEFLQHAQQIYGVIDGVYSSTKNEQVRTQASYLRTWFTSWMLKEKALAGSQ